MVFAVCVPRSEEMNGIMVVVASQELLIVILCKFIRQRRVAYNTSCVFYLQLLRYPGFLVLSDQAHLPYL